MEKETNVHNAVNYIYRTIPIHKITKFSSNIGIDKFMVHQSIFFAQSSPNMFNGPKYLS